MCVPLWLIDQGIREVQPVHFAIPTSKAAVTTRMQVKTSVFCGIILNSLGAHRCGTLSRETSGYRSHRGDMCLKFVWLANRDIPALQCSATS